MCVQDLLPGQPAASCVIQIIASSNKTVWSGIIGDTPILSPPPSGIPGSGGGGAAAGLTEGEKAAIIVVSVVGGLILLGLLAAVLCVRQRRKWAPAKGEFDGAVMAGGGGQRRAETETSEDVAEEGSATVPGTPSTVHHSPAQARPAPREGELEAGLGGSSPLSAGRRDTRSGEGCGAQVVIRLGPDSSQDR